MTAIAPDLQPACRASSEGPGGSEIDTVRRLLATQANAMTSAGHDLRQPLQIVLGVIDRFRQRPNAELDAFWLDTARSEIMRLNDGLTALTARAVDMGEPTLTTFALASVFDEIEAIWSVRACKARTALQVERPNCLVRSDRRMLGSIIGNLVDNALRHAPGGIVRLVADDRDSVTIHIEDDGPGIPPARLDEILSPPSRRQLVGDATAGLGLGLWLVTRTAQQLGHSLDVWTKSGQGTRFSIRIDH